MKLSDQIAQARLGLRTERCHTIPHHGSYTVGHHVAGCLLLAFYLYPESFEKLAVHILAHDLPEVFVGDIPSTTKRYANAGFRDTVKQIEDNILEDLGLPKQKNMELALQNMLKAVDLLDFILWAHDQVKMGNSMAIDALTETVQQVQDDPALMVGAALPFFCDLLKSGGLHAKQNDVVRSAAARG
jgi:5'-deoxynucleotidase YfbR-like HD superfamily hydrolase